MLAATNTRAQDLTDKGYYRVADSQAYSTGAGVTTCNEPFCTHYTTNGGIVDTSDYAVGQEVYVNAPNLPSGSTVSFTLVQPNGTTDPFSGKYTWNWNSGNTAGCWTWNYGGQQCSSNSATYLWAFAGPLSCQFPVGPGWTFETYFNGTLEISHTYVFEHNPNGPLGITSPLVGPDSPLFALIDLAADQNPYTATDSTCPGSPNPNTSSPNLTSACLSAKAATTNQIIWTANLKYATSGGLGPINDPHGPFPTNSGEMHSEVYKNEGGQVLATATTTLSDGGTVTDCTTFYIEGPAGGILNRLLTDQLVNSTTQSYQRSTSYPSGGTPALMAQVAVKESTYRQFTSPVDTPANADLWRLQSDFGITAKWPDESPGGGKYIALMQVMTDANQTSDPNAWNWITNANDGVNLFSGTPPSEFNDTENKIQHATDYENEMIQEYIPGPPPPKAAPAFGLGAREYGTATLRRVRQGSDDAVLRARVLVGALLLHPINQLLGLCGRDVVMVSEFVGEPLWSELCGQCQVTNNTAIAGRMESDYENGGLFNDTDVFPLDTALSRLQRKGVLQPSERRCLARR